ncbi:MAG: efflux RND transporter periplasmic adaptor subunit [Pseudodesulfovibrio sp.]|uniref:efflux RND transporter periplasmic adaptor subunit n=1 Tax=Pseudodesulfovibrio sp. TaxID=2035812 RepID=UPI003D12CA69
MKTKQLLALLSLTFILTTVIVTWRVISPNDTQASASPKTKRPPTVKAVRAAMGDISEILELTGTVEPYRIARLASPAEGPVFEVLVREGDLVQSDTPLLSIGRRRGINAKIASLREEAKKEENDLRRARQLVQKGVITSEEVNQSKIDYEKARAQLIEANESAQDHIIRAPWRGVVTNILVKEGEFVAPRAVLLEMYEPSSLIIRAALPENLSTEVSPGMQVEVRLDAYPQKKFEGRLDRVYPYLDPQSRSRMVEILLDEAVSLLPGMFARLEIPLHTAKDVVVLPSSAVLKTSKGATVFVVKDGHAVKRPVSLGIESENRIQIISGVTPKDLVIVAGNEKLKDGVVVSLMEGSREKKDDIQKAKLGKGQEAPPFSHAQSAFAQEAAGKK